MGSLGLALALGVLIGGLAGLLEYWIHEVKEWQR